MIMSPDSLTSGVASNTDGASFQVVPAAGTGHRLLVSSIYAINTSATAITVNIRNGLGGATRWTLHVPANGSTVMPFPLPLAGFGENTPICAQASAATTTLTISINAFKRHVTI